MEMTRSGSRYCHQVSKSERHKTTRQKNVHRKGEINLLGERNLETVELSSFFPAQEYDFVSTKDLIQIHIRTSIR